MKITKRIISLVMAIAVLASLFVAVPASAETTSTSTPITTELLNWTFDGEEDGIKFDAMTSIWSNSTDGFLNPTKRWGHAQTESNDDREYLRVSNASTEWIMFNNIGAGRTEATNIDDAQYFGADSMFGTPYYVEFEFNAVTLAEHPQIFGQHFAGTVNGTEIASSGPRIYMNGNGYLAFADGFTSPTGVTGNEVNSFFTTQAKQQYRATANTWHRLKVYVDPAARTYKVWFDDTAVQKADETGTEPSVFKFGATYNSVTSTAGAGSTSTSVIDGKNTNEYFKDTVLAPNRTRINTYNQKLLIDNLRMYRVSTTELLDWDFDDETAGTALTGLDLWENSTDGFYGVDERDTNHAKVYGDTVDGETKQWLRITASSPNAWTTIKNVGVGQTEAACKEATYVPDAADFGANSMFGTPYFVEFEFNAVTIDPSRGLPQLFGQYFEGTLNGQTIVSSGPRIDVNGNGYLAFTDGFASDTSVEPHRIISHLTSNTKELYQITANTWHHLKVYVDPASRTYQVWFDGTPVQKATEDSLAPTAFKFGAVMTGEDAGTTDTSIINGKNIEAYLANQSEIKVLAPNRTRFQSGAAEFRIDSLKFYRNKVDEILLNLVSEIDFDVNKMLLPTSYSNYTVTWESLNPEIVDDDGLVTFTDESQTATFNVTLTDKSGEDIFSGNVDITIPARLSMLDKIYKTPQKLASRAITETTGLTTHYLSIEGEPTVRTYATSQSWTSDGKSFICALQSGDMFLYNTEDETLTFIDHSYKATLLLWATVGTDDYVYYIKKDDFGEYSIWKANLKVAPAVPEFVCAPEGDYSGYKIGLIHITNDCKYISAELYSPENSSESISARYSVDKDEWVGYTHPSFDFSPAKTHDIINPEYPNLMSFCHEINHDAQENMYARNITDRIWQVDLDTMEAKNIFKQGVQGQDAETGYDIALQGATHEVWSNDGEYMYFVSYSMGSYNTGSVPAVVRFDKDGSHRKYYHSDNSHTHAYNHCTATGDNKFVGVGGSWIVVMSTETWEEFPISKLTGPGTPQPYEAHPVIAREKYVMNWGDTDENEVLGVKWFDFTNLVSSKAEGGSTPMGENVNRVSYAGLECESVETTQGGQNCIKAASGNAIYLDIDESLIDTDNGKIKLTFEYYDNGSNSITMTYTSGVETDNDRYRIFDAQKTISRKGTNTWKTAEIIIDSGNFEDIGKYNTDIKVSGGTSAVSIANVKAELYGAEKIISDIEEEFKAMDYKISEGYTLPALPAEYSGYTLTWTSNSNRIRPSTGEITTGTKSDATLTVTASDGQGDVATATFDVSLFVDYTAEITPVDYQIDGITFEDADGNVAYSPANSGKLKSVRFKNNTGSAQKVNLIAAVYENDTLNTCKIAENVQDGSINFDLTLSASAQGAEVKFYVWSGDGKLTPLDTTKSVDESGRKLVILADQIYDETPPTNQYSTGLGLALKDFFNQISLPIVNLAQSGTSYEIFGENLFGDALAQISEGDYVLLSFCHTDAKYTGLDSDGVAPFEIGSYEYFMEKYVEAIRLKGGIPIIATAIPRHTFGGGMPTSTHGGYYTAAIKVAKYLDVPLMDVYSKTFDDLKTLGAVETRKYYVNPVGANTAIGTDYTHLSEEGADWVSKIIVELAEELKLPFAKYSLER